MGGSHRRSQDQWSPDLTSRPRFSRLRLAPLGNTRPELGSLARSRSLSSVLSAQQRLLRARPLIRGLSHPRLLRWFELGARPQRCAGALMLTAWEDRLLRELSRRRGSLTPLLNCCLSGVVMGESAGRSEVAGRFCERWAGTWGPAAPKEG